jgi:hypothetical protein
MECELVGYAEFLERREQRRTADRGRAFPGAIGTTAPAAGGGTVIDCERIDVDPALPRAAGPVEVAAVVTPRTPGPVPRRRARRPAPDD